MPHFDKALLSSRYWLLNNICRKPYIKPLMYPRLELLRELLAEDSSISYFSFREK